MAEQTFIFVVLPRAPASGGKLGLSVLLTPRLAGAPTLASFPDLLSWPQRIADHGLTFELASGARTATVAVDRSVLRPDVWSRILGPETVVDEYRIPDFADRLFVSYPVRDALAYLKWAYQAVAAGRNRERGLELVLSNLVFRDGDASTLEDALAEMRVELWRMQQANVAPRVRARATGPDGVPRSLTQPADTRTTITRFALFHHIPPAPNRPPLPSTTADFAKTLDFHRALTALSSYPSLLRALGLVFDLEVSDTLCAPSPNGGYATIAVRAVTPGTAWSTPPVLCLPQTAYVRDASTFLPAPSTDPAQVETGAYEPGDVVDGLLALTPADFSLLQVDLDGALHKALSLADTVAYARNSDAVGEALPALRSAGIGLAADGRARQLLEALADNSSFDEALAANTALPRPLAARDVTRGYRLDIWSSRTQQWHSLHRRDAVYRFGEHADLAIHVADEEGFVQPSVAQPADDPTRPHDLVATANGVPQPGTDVFVHERLARWAGWSLSAARPGGAINKSPDPALATTPDPTVGEPATPFKLTTSFTVTPGTLPELRFGARYRVRTRAVDLAGNSVALTAPAPDALVLPADGALIQYRRFEPVPPPLVVLQRPPSAGGSLERLVIRTHNSSPAGDVVPTGEVDARHVAPPKTSVRLVEQHGLLDDAQGRLRGDQATYAMLVERDRAQLPVQGDVPLEPGPLLAVTYLSDALARGAALRGLPGAPAGANGRIDAGSLVYRPLPDVQPRPSSVTFLDFGSAWPDRSAFRLQLVEGAAKPAWDGAQRTLTVGLPKAGVAEVELSSYVSERDLELLGVWGWIRELFDEAQEELLATGGSAVAADADMLALLTRLVLEGGHEMITPARTLTLVHAVQQPLGLPTFEQLPVVHRPESPIFASALRNSFTPITAWRYRNSHSAVLLGGLTIHGASSIRVDLQAGWEETVDDPGAPAPTTSNHRDHVETILLPTLEDGVLYADSSQARAVAVYVSKVDALWFAAPFDDLDGVETPGDVAAPQHHFADTKHRWVAYRAIATSRFQEYFDDTSLDFTRAGEPLLVDVPSSARPAAPSVAYVVPIFGWERQETTNVKSSIRFGNALRVYLDRPWYSSGVDELLGVVLWPEGAPDPDAAARETYKPYFTQWGNDPIWQSGDLAAVPGTWDFPAAVASGNGLSLEGTTLTVDVAGHAVAFDATRRLWYCDIPVANSTAYNPFIRLALARYQPHSIAGVELSRVVLADFAQLTATRSAVLMIDPDDPRRARLYVGGLAPQAPMQSVVQVTIERQRPDVQTDLGWETVGADVAAVAEDDPAPTAADSVLWAGSISFVQHPARGRFRVVVREFERIAVDSPDEEPLFAMRLVYAATVAYDDPTAG